MATQDALWIDGGGQDIGVGRPYRAGDGAQSPNPTSVSTTERHGPLINPLNHEGSLYATEPGIPNIGPGVTGL